MHLYSSLFLLCIFLLLPSIMGNVFWFAAGTIFGVYLQQNYELPNVKTALLDIKKKIDSLEKKPPNS